MINASRFQQLELVEKIEILIYSNAQNSLNRWKFVRTVAQKDILQRSAAMKRRKASCVTFVQFTYIDGN